MTVLMMSLDSPLGVLRLHARGDALTGLYLPAQVAPLARPGRARVLELAAAQLAEYFAGERTTFAVPLAAIGTPFQHDVWDALVAIPYGATRSYGELATALGRPTGGRAVGAANGKNPISIIVPCHRVIAASGELTGYAGGLPAKQWLLAHERTAASSSASAARC
jgi:methylated-DNA-[protein]-cysteine S-methyltransferase